MIPEINEVISWILIFTRIICAISVVPFMIQKSIPNSIKIGLSGIMATIVTLTLTSHMVVEDVLSLGFILAKEIAVGLIIGLGISMLFEVYYFVGQLLSVQSSLSMAMVLDPVSSGQVTVIGKLLGLAFTTIFVSTEGVHWFIKELIHSFVYIPIGQIYLKKTVIGVMIEGIQIFFVLGIKIAGPIVGVLFIIDCAMGILAKAVPQMNMFVVGIPIKILILFFLLYIFSQGFGVFYNLVMEQMKVLYFDIMEGLIP